MMRPIRQFFLSFCNAQWNEISPIMSDRPSLKLAPYLEGLSELKLIPQVELICTMYCWILWRKRSVHFTAPVRLWLTLLFSTCTSAISENKWTIDAISGMALPSPNFPSSKASTWSFVWLFISYPRSLFSQTKRRKPVALSMVCVLSSHNSWSHQSWTL